MKKFALLCICGAVAAAVLTGCASSDSMGTVKLGEYKGVSVDVPAVEVTDEELNSKIRVFWPQTRSTWRWTARPRRATS